jgi:hypothetical protein
MNPCPEITDPGRSPLSLLLIRKGKSPQIRGGAPAASISRIDSSVNSGRVSW